MIVNTLSRAIILYTREGSIMSRIMMLILAGASIISRDMMLYPIAQTLRRASRCFIT